MLKKCEYCKKDIPDPRSNKKFCCASCRQQSYLEKGKGDRLCIICGNTLDAPRRLKYCTECKPKTGEKENQDFSRRTSATRSIHILRDSIDMSSYLPTHRSERRGILLEVQKKGFLEVLLSDIEELEKVFGEIPESSSDNVKVSLIQKIRKSRKRLQGESKC